MTRPPTAMIARHVDRLVIAVHRLAMARVGDDLRQSVQRIDLRRPGHLLDLAEFIAAGMCTSEVVRLRFRYEDAAAAQLLDDLADLRERGLLDDGGLPDGRLAPLVDTVLLARSAAATSLWGDDLDTAARGAVESLSAGTGALVERFRALPEPTSPAHLLHHLLTGIRYVRMDSHDLAWRSRGMAANEIVALSQAATGQTVEIVPPLLVERGWLTSSGAVTPASADARADIEAATNRGCDAMFGAVTAPERWFAEIAALPPTE